MQDKPQFLPAVMRGISGRCPKCGQGRLFAGYLKQVQNCSVCKEELGKISPDDGPAWLTIFIVGHILAPFLLFILPKVTWSDGQIMAVIMVLMMVLTCAILPRAKGVFIALLWRSGWVGEK